MTVLYGGTVRRLVKRCRGKQYITTVPSILFNSGEHTIATHHSHGDVVEHTPPGFLPTAWLNSKEGGSPVVVAMECAERKRYGVQFHPEGIPSNTSVIKCFVQACRMTQNEPRTTTSFARVQGEGDVIN